jgi:hypothetical protein
MEVIFSQSEGMFAGIGFGGSASGTDDILEDALSVLVLPVDALELDPKDAEPHPVQKLRYLCHSTTRTDRVCCHRWERITRCIRRANGYGTCGTHWVICCRCEHMTCCVWRSHGVGT